MRAEGGADRAANLRPSNISLHFIVSVIPAGQLSACPATTLPTTAALVRCVIKLLRTCVRDKPAAFARAPRDNLQLLIGATCI